MTTDNNTFAGLMRKFNERLSVPAYAEIAAYFLTSPPIEIPGIEEIMGYQRSSSDLGRLITSAIAMKIPAENLDVEALKDWATDSDNDVYGLAIRLLLTHFSDRIDFDQAMEWAKSNRVSSEVTGKIRMLILQRFGEKVGFGDLILWALNGDRDFLKLRETAINTLRKISIESLNLDHLVHLVAAAGDRNWEAPDLAAGLALRFSGRIKLEEAMDLLHRHRSSDARFLVDELAMEIPAESLDIEELREWVTSHNDYIRRLALKMIAEKFPSEIDFEEAMRWMGNESYAENENLIRVLVLEKFPGRVGLKDLAAWIVSAKDDEDDPNSAKVVDMATAALQELSADQLDLAEIMDMQLESNDDFRNIAVNLARKIPAEKMDPNELREWANDDDCDVQALAIELLATHFGDKLEFEEVMGWINEMAGWPAENMVKILIIERFPGRVGLKDLANWIDSAEDGEDSDSVKVVDMATAALHQIPAEKLNMEEIMYIQEYYGSSIVRGVVSELAMKIPGEKLKVEDLKEWMTDGDNDVRRLAVRLIVEKFPGELTFEELMNFLGGTLEDDVADPLIIEALTVRVRDMGRKEVLQVLRDEENDGARAVLAQVLIDMED